MNSCLRPSLLGCIALSAGLLAAGPAMAVELEQLWVPKSYMRHMPRLYDAAERVEQWSRCAELLEGTTHLDRTTEKHPVFTITCRNAEGRTFSVLVDGPTLKKVDEARPGGLVTFEQLEREREQAEARRQERERKRAELEELEERSREAERESEAWRDWWQAEHERRRELWAECVAALEERVGGMKAIEWLTETMPEPAMAAEPELDSHPPLVFTVDFNAESYYGEPLFYRAECGADEEGVELDIGARERSG